MLARLYSYKSVLLVNMHAFCQDALLVKKKQSCVHVTKTNMKQSQKLDTIITYVAPLKCGHQSNQWQLKACVEEIRLHYFLPIIFTLHNFILFVLSVNCNVLFKVIKKKAMHVLSVLSKHLFICISQSHTWTC